MGPFLKSYGDREGCASSEISSVDSYSDDRRGREVRDSLVELMEIIATAGNSQMVIASKVSSASTSHSSILDPHDLSSSSDSEAHSKRRSEQSGLKLECSQSTSTGPKSTLEKAVRVKPRRTRTPMGTYIPPPGGGPLTRSYFTSPGPAAYRPNFSTIMKSVPDVHLASRHEKSPISYGPGPAAYMATKECCPENYNEQHFSFRFDDVSTPGPGPAFYDPDTSTVGKNTPRAIILSRRREKRKSNSHIKWPDLSGFTRFGQPKTQSAFLFSKPFSVPQPGPGGPGPGSYDPDKCRNCKVGIRIRGKPKDIIIGNDSPGPKYAQSSASNGPSWSMGGRHSKLNESCSPGPIYAIPSEPKNSFSMTFRPFPLKSRQDGEHLAPNHYQNVGEQSLNTKTVAPKALIGERKFPNFEKGRRPAPNKYFPPIKIGFSSYNECSMKGSKNAFPKAKRRRQRGQPGPADYKIPSISTLFKQAPRAIIPRELNLPPADNTPEFSYAPKPDRGSTRNVFLSPRFIKLRHSLCDQDIIPFTDMTGFTPRGKDTRIPVSFKSRQSPFVYQGMSKVPFQRSGGSCNLVSRNYEQLAKVRQETQSLQQSVPGPSCSW